MRKKTEKCEGKKSQDKQTPRYLPSRDENLHSHKNLYTNTKEALLIITKNWKQRKCPLMGEGINKFLLLHSMECHSAIERNELLDTYKNKDDSQRHYAKRKKPVSKSCILHCSIYITFGTKQNHSYREQRSSCQSLGM